MVSKDKLYAVKINDEEIPVNALADNVKWNEDFNLSIKEILGNVEASELKDNEDNINDNKTIQGQLNLLKNNKLDQITLETYVNTELGKKVYEYENTILKPNTILKTENLAESNNLDIGSTGVATVNQNQLYPVVKDKYGKLSVGVPWTDTTVFADFQNVWSGICTTGAGESVKYIILDKIDDNFEIKKGTTIAVYFEKGNTAISPMLFIENTDEESRSIYYYTSKENMQIMDGTISEAWYTFTPGLKFFTCCELGNELVWLLTTIDYSLISHINSESGALDSPEFTGIPTAPTPSVESNNNQLATTAFVHNANQGVLKTSDLKSTENAIFESVMASNMENRQYPIVKDQNGKLSVNVPWVNNSAINNIWTGICRTAAVNAGKQIEDLSSDFSVRDGTILIVYFTSGNTASQPHLRINNNSYDIYYPTSATEIGKIINGTTSVISNWGIGLKIFVYNSVYNGWVLQPDMFSIWSLFHNKANLNSPDFQGTPTADTPSIESDNRQLATTAFVKNKINSTLQTRNQSIASDFDTTTTYLNGDYVYYNDKLYKFVVSHSPGDWNINQVYQVSIAKNLQKVQQTLDDILIKGLDSTTCINVGNLTNFIPFNGFHTQSLASDLAVFQYLSTSSSSSNIEQPFATIYNNLNKGVGNWLIGFKYKINYNYPSIIQNHPFLQFSGLGSHKFSIAAADTWYNASIYSFNANLSGITIDLVGDVNNYSNVIIKFSIKDFYIYNLNEQIANNINFREYIIQEQNRNYRSGTVIYQSPNPYLDETLAEDGKVPNSKTIGDVIQKILGNFATVETSSIASQAYNIGESLIYNNTMYKVTTAIAQGDTITPEINVEETTVAATCDETIRQITETMTTAETAELNITADPTYGFVGRLRKIGKVATLVLGSSGYSRAVFPVFPGGAVLMPLEIGTFPPGFEPVAGDFVAPVLINYIPISGDPIKKWGQIFYGELSSGNKLYIQEGSSSNQFGIDSVVVTYLTV